MNRRKLFGIFIALICASQAFAGGFQVNLLGIKQTAMGHAGAGLYLDAAGLVLNPGSAAFADRSSFVAGANAILARVNYLEPAPGNYSTYNERTISPPFAVHGNVKINDKMAVGASIYTPFGSRVLYADDWKGQFLLREISLRTFFIQPTFSYKITDKIGVGVGPIFATGSVALRRAAPVQFQDGSYGEANLSGSGTGYGFNAGVYVEATEALSIGAAFRSPVKFKAEEGMAEFSVPSALSEFFPTTTFSTQITLPFSATLGAGYKLSNGLTLVGQFDLIGWSVYDTLGFDFAQNTDNLDDLASPREYKNSWYARLGAQYSIGIFDIRGGFYFDKSPVQDGYTTPETPDSDKFGITAGGTARIGDNLEIDASFMWVEAKKRFDINLENNFGGTYKARAFVPSLGVTYNFGNLE